MDRDRIEGNPRVIGGRVKALVGRLVGDAKMQTQGELDQVQGNLQNAVGRLKDSIEDDVPRRST